MLFFSLKIEYSHFLTVLSQFVTSPFIFSITGQVKHDKNGSRISPLYPNDFLSATFSVAKSNISSGCNFTMSQNLYIQHATVNLSGCSLPFIIPVNIFTAFETEVNSNCKIQISSTAQKHLFNFCSKISSTFKNSPKKIICLSIIQKENNFFLKCHFQSNHPLDCYLELPSTFLNCEPATVSYDLLPSLYFYARDLSKIFGSFILFPSTSYIGYYPHYLIL